MKELVISALDAAPVRRIAFNFGPMSIDPAGYSGVKEAVRDESIDVRHNRRLGQNGARYRHKPENVFFLGFRSLGGNADRQALIVHEATHAVCDLAAEEMKLKESEAGAYIAQCMFFYLLNEDALRDGSQTPTFRSAILRRAWPIARAAVDRPQIAVNDLEPLYQAIANHRSYRGREDDDVDYDG